MLRTLLAAIATASAYALALPPFDVDVLAWVAIVPLILVIDPTRPRRAFLQGATIGFCTSVTVTWWLAPAIAAFFDAGLLMGALATAAAYAIAVASTFGLFATGLARLQRMPRSLVTPFTIAAWWVTCELLRTRLFQDPWALLGYTQHERLALIQVAALTGVYGVSFLLLLGNLAVAAVVQRARLDRPLLAGIVVVLGTWAAGAYVLARPNGEPGRPLRVAVVQPNVEPAVTWTPSWADIQLFAHVRLTRSAAPDAPHLIVWPENSVAHQLDERPDVRGLLASLATTLDADLVVGGPRHAGGLVYNAARVVRPRLGVTDAYHKQRLVPFAERRLFSEPVADGSPSPSAFAAGERPGVLRGRASYGVSICHEALFPEVVHGAVLDGAEVLVNIANDGWLDGGFGVASRQHAAMAVFRAVEARRALVRAATTGVSLVIDPHGRVLAAQPPGEAGVVAATVSTARSLTPYAAMGDLFAWTCLAVVALAVRPRAKPATLDEPASVPA